MTSNADVKVLEANDTCAIGEFERCLLTVWRLQPTQEAFERRNAFVLDLASRFPGRCAYLELIEPTSKPPPGKLRQVSVEVFPKLGSDLSCVGVLVEGTQVRSTVVRAILTGMTFLIPKFQPNKVFKRRDDMAAWAQALIGAEPGFAERLSSAFDVLQRSIPASGSSQGAGFST